MFIVNIKRALLFFDKKFGDSYPVFCFLVAKFRLYGCWQWELERLFGDLDPHNSVNKGRMSIIQKGCLIFFTNWNDVVKATANTKDWKFDKCSAFVAFVFPRINILDFTVINEKNGNRFWVLILIHADYLATVPARISWVFRDDLIQKGNYNILDFNNSTYKDLLY